MTTISKCHVTLGGVPLSLVTTQLSLGSIGLMELKIMAFVISLSTPMPIPMLRFQCRGLQMAPSNVLTDIRFTSKKNLKTPKNLFLSYLNHCAINYLFRPINKSNCNVNTDKWLCLYSDHKKITRNNMDQVNFFSVRLMTALQVYF